MSMDTLEGNGHVAKRPLPAFAGRREPALGAWFERKACCPNSMVDRITPQTTDEDRAALREGFGIDDRWPVVCESYTQWVLEDDFANGRPPYEHAGVQVVGDVRPYEPRGPRHDRSGVRRELGPHPEVLAARDPRAACRGGDNKRSAMGPAVPCTSAAPGSTLEQV